MSLNRRMEAHFDRIERDLRLLIWMVGVNLAASASVIFLLLRQH